MSHFDVRPVIAAASADYALVTQGGLLKRVAMGDLLHRAASGYFEPVGFRRDHLTTPAQVATVNALTGPNVYARFAMETGTPSSYVIFALADANGVPYRAISNGPAVLSSFDDSDTHYFRTNAGVHKVVSSPTALIASTTIYSNNMLMQGDGTHAFVRPINSPGVLFLGADNTNKWGVNTSTFYPVVDNALDIGFNAGRVRNLYLGASPIVTSDAREKHWLGGLTEAHIAAAREIMALGGFYQWMAERAAKGDDVARIHFGWRAQTAIQIFIKHGLEAEQLLDLPADAFIASGDRPSFRHAFFCFDTWDETREPIREPRMVPVEVTELSPVLGPDGQPAPKTRTVEVEQLVETGETRVTLAAGNRFGLRVDQLIAFLLVALAAGQDDMEKRLAWVEKAVGA